MPAADTLKRQWAEQDALQIDGAINALLQHQHGRRLLWWLLEIGKVGQQPFSIDASRTAFACGELNVGQRILDRVISVSPEGYIKMMEEMADERKQRDAELARAVDGDDADSDPDSADYADR